MARTDAPGATEANVAGLEARTVQPAGGETVRRTFSIAAVFVLTKLEFEYPFVVWTITIPAWIFSFVRGMRQGKAEGKSSHFNKISAALWLSFGVVVFTLVAFGYKINYELNPIILLISAIPTFASGVILRFKPLIIGGILFWLFSIASFLIARDLQPLLGSIAIVFCYLIPGYILKGKKD